MLRYSRAYVLYCTILYYVISMLCCMLPLCLYLSKIRLLFSLLFPVVCLAGDAAIFSFFVLCCMVSRRSCSHAHKLDLPEGLQSKDLAHKQALLWYAIALFVMRSFAFRFSRCFSRASASFLPSSSWPLGSASFLPNITSLPSRAKTTTVQYSTVQESKRMKYCKYGKHCCFSAPCAPTPLAVCFWTCLALQYSAFSPVLAVVDERCCVVLCCPMELEIHI